MKKYEVMIRTAHGPFHYGLLDLVDYPTFRKVTAQRYGVIVPLKDWAGIQRQINAQIIKRKAK